jgi:hypothetical protein
MTFTSGGRAYNIIKNGKFAIRIKGINGVEIVNNTFYNGDRSGWYFLLITENMDRPDPAPSVGTKVFNNIFYTTSRIPMIKIQSDCFEGFECDYNVYWSTAGTPIFNVDNRNITFEQWQALGYDTHSVVVNPQFKDMTNFVPASRLDFGKDLGNEWEDGLSTSADWEVGVSPSTTKQNGTWQVGARVYDDQSVSTPIDSTEKDPMKVIVETDRIKVLVDPELTESVANLYNINGDLLSVEVVTGDQFFFDIGSFPTGVYVIILEKNDFTVVEKVVIP